MGGLHLPWNHHHFHFAAHARHLLPQRRWHALPCRRAWIVRPADHQAFRRHEGRRSARLQRCSTSRKAVGRCLIVCTPLFVDPSSTTTTAVDLPLLSVIFVNQDVASYPCALTRRKATL